MLFNSFSFLFFFLTVFVLYWFVFRKKLVAQNLLLLIASYVFYGLWDWRFLSLIAISSCVDFIAGKRIHEAESKKARKAWLWLSLGVNLGILGFFKYCDFFIASAIDLMTALGMQPDITTLGIILPVGISFYTFQTLSYTIDIYRGKIEPSRNILGFFTFVAFFPQLVAGPIERAARLLPQIESRRTFSYPQAVDGCRLILWGLFKKVAIADQLGLFVNEVYAAPEEFGGLSVLVALVAFTFQVYCDFSGYSDIAIGTARLLGIDLMTNFRFPLFARNQQDFWRRWHISLSTWFRDYVYIPLGGSKFGLSRQFLAIVVTFFISGIWHGADYTFVIWGTLTGLFFALEAITLRNVKIPAPLPGWLAVLCFGGLLILFRSPDLDIAGGIMSGLTDWNSALGGWNHFATQFTEAISGTAGVIPIFGTFVLFFLLEWRVRHDSSDRIFDFRNKTVRYGLYYVVFILTFVFSLNYEPETFIYFQF